MKTNVFIYGSHRMTYWVDEDRDSTFCLIDAPDKEAVRKIHDRAHGLIPHEIIQVNNNFVDAFLAMTQNTEIFEELAQPDIKGFNDPAFRIIMVTEIMDAGIMEFKHGADKAAELRSLYHDKVRELLKKYEGREVETDSEGFVTSFVSVTQAVDCAIGIQNALHIATELMDLRIALNAGMPVRENDVLFGATLKFARYLIQVGSGNQIVISNLVKDLYKEDHRKGVTKGKQIKWLSLSEENFLEMIMNSLSDSWQDHEFGIEDFCKKLSTSKSQLYRKSTTITGLSPNSLLREYRLIKSLELLRKQDRNIAQTTFDTGFSSPSYFTKCFQKRFGLQPLAYLKAQA